MTTPTLIHLRELSAGRPIAATVFRELAPVVVVAAAFVAKQKISDHFGAELEALEKALIKGGFCDIETDL